MNYTGEHLLPGQLGHFFAVLSLVTSLVATVSFYKSNKSVLKTEKEGWDESCKRCLFAGNHLCNRYH